MAPPAANGTISANLSDPAAATDIDNRSITLTLVSPVAAVVGPITLASSGLPAIPAVSPFSQGFYVSWAAALQAAIRGAGADAAVSPEHRAYFTGATVDLIGDGSVANPRRFVIRAGKGAQPYDPAATFTFGGADAPNYGLAAPTYVGPQQFLPTAVSGANGDIVDPATGNYLVPAVSFRGNPLAQDRALRPRRHGSRQHHLHA